MAEDKLILVDIFDRPVGSAGKAEAHRRGLLHRAFSVFLVSGNTMLIQQRALHKYHSGGLWSNACCSHPRVGESLTDAVYRRLQEELGLQTPCHEVGEFVYRHEFSQELFEYEYDHIFVGEYSGEVKLNPEEAMAMRWIGLNELADDLRKKPQKYSVWFLTAAPMVLTTLKNKNYSKTSK